jgi:hypothetical protein
MFFQKWKINWKFLFVHLFALPYYLTFFLKKTPLHIVQLHFLFIMHVKGVGFYVKSFCLLLQNKQILVKKPSSRSSFH